MSQTMSPQCASTNVLGGVKKRFIPCSGDVTSEDKKQIPDDVEGPTQLPPYLPPFKL